MSKKTQDSTVLFYLNPVDIIRLLAVIILLPASVMSISFLMEGHAPPIIGIVLFSVGIFSPWISISYYL